MFFNMLPELIVLWLEAYLADVVLLPYVFLKVEEGGEVQAVADLADEPGPGGSRRRGARTDVRDEAAVVEEDVLADVAGKHLGVVCLGGVLEQGQVRGAVLGRAVGTPARVNE